jgi:AbrB family looped-hinge helix DNA binding protein
MMRYPRTQGFLRSQESSGAINLAKLSANGQITVPAEVRRRLHLVPGDKVLFVEKPNGEVVVAKAGLSALAQAQAAFAGAASDVGVADEDDVQALVDDLRGRVS